MENVWERIVSTLLAIAAIAFAVVLVHREFVVSPRTGTPTQPRKSEPVPGWREILRVGRIVGDSSARVKIIEFADLECPFCRQFSATLRHIRSRYPRDVAIVFVHFPLPGHRFARPAARAAECAHLQRRFAEMVHAIYERQDSLGLKPWTSYAAAAGVGDTARFAQCAADTSALPIVDAGVIAARNLDVNATPTVLLNDWRYGTAPSEAELLRDISDVLAGRKRGRRGAAH